MNIGLHLKRAAVYFPERTAVIDVGENTRLTYKELNERVNRLANALSDLGLKKGDRIASLSHNRYQLFLILYACYKSGLIAVPLNARLSMAELVHMMNNSEASALILGPEYIEEIKKVQSDIKTVKHYICISQTPLGMIDFDDIINKAPADEPKIEVEIDDLCDLKFTSGTTGVLKAVMMTHRNKLCQARKGLLRDDGINQDSVMCHTAPLTHASSAMLLPIIMRGGKALILPGFDIPALLNTIQREKVTNIFAVPTMLNMLMNYPDLKKYDISSLKTITYSSSPMPVEQIKQALKVFGPVLTQAYGLTEASASVTLLTKKDHDITDGDPKKLKRLASAGRPESECEVRVVNEAGEDVQPGEVGEILERGDDTMVGYWKDPELTATTLINGWLHTKDMGYFDEDGYLYLVDRKGDMIISGGFNIYPSEVEGVIAGHPAVFESAVIGVPDEIWGESVKALVVLKEGMTASEDDIIELCKQHLSSYKKPKSVEFIKEIPKNPYGKVLKRKLRENYWAGRERMI